MSKRTPVNIEAVMDQEKPVLEAIRKGSREAMRRHIQAGVPMVSMKDGKMVKIPPEELEKMLLKQEIP